jgi:hypothetical protein
MQDFPELMKNLNCTPDKDQHTQSIEGYYFEDAEDSRAACWFCRADQTSKEHSHDFDKYMICIDGQYNIAIGDKKTAGSGKRIFHIQRRCANSGKVKAETHAIHAFCCRRIQTRL